MIECRILDYDGRWIWIHTSRWNGEWYDWGDDWTRPDYAEEGVLYRGMYGDEFYTRHNGKVLYLKILGDWRPDHQQLHELIEGGLSVYDAFKVMAL